MWSWANRSMRQLCWMLALLAPVQPLLALDCRCTHCSHTGGLQDNHDPRPDHSFIDNDPCCNRCHEDTESISNSAVRRGTTPTKVLSFCPCDCPTDCECQVRHSTGLGALRCIADTERIAHQPIPVVTWVHPNQSFSKSASAGNSEGLTDLFAISALSLCASLCRFLA